MTNEQILKKAIEVAVENGWRWFLDKKATLMTWNLRNCKNAIERGDAYFVIFNHQFAKALFGENERGGMTITREGGATVRELWQSHLQIMVLEPEPLKYIERFLEENANT